MIFFMLLNNDNSPPAIIISFLISMIYIFSPTEDINLQLFKIKESEPNKITYEEARINFETVLK